MAEFVKIEGFAALEKMLRELPERIAQNGLSAAVSAGAAVIRSEAKIRAPVYTGAVAEGHPPPGTLARSIVQKQIPERSGPYRQVFYVTVRHGSKFRGQGKRGNLSQDAYYWRWVEFGTSKMAARPFLRPAFEGKKQEAVTAIKEKLTARIVEELIR